ncbi:MAG TPA: zinc-dependent alcohol dehydrogenase family protein [Tepidisphaeraceae bacterium]|nr:zinc-dependent alcohol dehydrogenase family protein [Tepidisphaeraceae bacterium]
MRAMMLPSAGPIESSPLQLADWPIPTPGADEVRLKVRCCAICRTDLHIIEGDLPLTDLLPIIPGHQIVGLVDEVGSDCHRLKPGMRIGAAWLRRTCGVCRFCVTGRENLCLMSEYTGYHVPGGYAEYATVPESFAYELPETFSDVEAAPLLCAGLIGYRALKRANVPPDGTLAIFGFGSSAHLVIQLAVHRGNAVYVVSRNPSHQQLARQLGAAWAGFDVGQMPSKADSAILFAPVGSLVPTALEALDRGGTLSIAGIHMTPIPELDYDRYLFYERDIHPVTANTRRDARELLEEAGKIRVRPWTVTYPLEHANRALQDMKQGKIDGTGVLGM